ncbi:Non-specific lipid-transfer protein 3 [Abeliophyllum distichum]|uniref:Non-specific lipid-transfer protein n=1 Tax=Abeliophyllum distichum TaxID=126358 RepID=A0ABD1QT13_9LAMI
MASSGIVKAMCFVLIAVALVAPLAEAAISCGAVVGSLRPCLGYVQNSSPIVPPACCNGIRGLYASAKTPADRRSICYCLKSLASSYKGINFNKAAGLPGKCGVNIPYKISPSTDCSKVN